MAAWIWDGWRSSPDEDVVAELIPVKGVGAWTAEMFLIFHLGRPDVISTGDLGIRRAVQIAYGLGELPGPRDLERIAEPWRPPPDARLSISMAIAPQRACLAAGRSGPDLDRCARRHRRRLGGPGP